MRWSVRRAVVAGFGAGLLVLALIGSVAYRSAGTTAAEIARVREAADELAAYQELLARVADEQTAARGFELTAQAALLAPRDSALVHLPPLLARLHTLAAGDPLEQRGLDSLQGLIAARLAFSTAMIRLRRLRGEAAVSKAVATGSGTRLTDVIRSRVGALARRQLVERDSLVAVLQASARRTRTVVLAGWLVALLAVGAASLQVFRGLASREHAEAQVRDLAAELQDLYDNAPMGYHSLDASGTFVRINATELRWLGYTREEVVGRLRLTDLLAPAALPAFEATFARAKQEGEVHDVEFELRRKDGTFLPVAISATWVRDDAGRRVKSRGVLVDLTERRRMQAEVRTLSGLLPICAECRRIRDDRGEWSQIEAYVRDHSQAEFSHGICPDCYARLYPGFGPYPGPLARQPPPPAR